jgi:hypothetical protein
MSSGQPANISGTPGNAGNTMPKAPTIINTIASVQSRVAFMDESRCALSYVHDR